MKHRVSVTVDKDNYQVLSAAGVNISGLVNDAIGKEARRIKAEEWKKENREGCLIEKSTTLSKRSCLGEAFTYTTEPVGYAVLLLR